MIFFEDEGHKHFYPLALTRPMDDLRMGILKIHEKWCTYLDSHNYTRIVRPELEPVYGTLTSPKTEGSILWINSRFLPDKSIIHKLRNLKAGQGLSYSGVPVVIKLSISDSEKRANNPYPDFADIPCEPVNDGFLLTRIWELFKKNRDEIIKDFELLKTIEEPKPTNTEHSILVNQEYIHFGENVKVEVGVVIDASDGPVYIGSNVRIMSGSVLKGPIALCEGSIIKMGAKMYPETTVGPVCKVGGEVNNVIFQGYSNKAHDGYLGNSLIGEWCNLGADSNSSNLKNNYKSIHLNNWETGEPYKEGIDYCGTIMGDHSKTGINTMLGTGTVCGVACNLFASGFHPRRIPSFSWISDNCTETHQFTKALETAERVMARRNVSLSMNYRQMMQNIFDNR